MCVYPNRGLVYLQQCLIHHLKWEPGFHSVSPTGSDQRYPTPRLSYSDSSGTHLEAIWGSNPLLLPLPRAPPTFFGSPSPHHHPNPPKRLLPFSAEGSFKGLGESARAAVLARPRGSGAPR